VNTARGKGRVPTRNGWTRFPEKTIVKKFRKNLVTNKQNEVKHVNMEIRRRLTLIAADQGICQLTSVEETRL